MPFSRDYFFGRFKASELESLQRAYLRSCEILGRDPATTPNKDDMAGKIVQIYECGVVDPDRIAELLAQVESLKPPSAAERLAAQSLRFGAF